MKRIRYNIAMGIIIVTLAVFMMRKHYFRIMRGLIKLGIYDSGRFAQFVYGHLIAVHPHFASIVVKIRG